MRFEVSIFVESTWKGPARRRGVAMWMVEYKRNGVPVTREGLIRLEEGTENMANLMAVKEAAGILIKPCSIRVFTQCDHILNTMQNHWHIAWQKNEWHNAKGKPVKNAELWSGMLENLGKHLYTVQNGWHEYQNLMQGKIRKELEEWKNTEQ